MSGIARRVGMPDGQLYTTILAAMLVALLSLTGLPNAHQRSGADSMSGTSPVLGQPVEPAP
jgi:hypothetical protein